MEGKKLVMVTWADATGAGSEWQFRDDDFVSGIAVVESVGWLIQEDDEFVVVLPHYARNSHDQIKDQGIGEMSIPRCSIRSITDLAVLNTTHMNRIGPR